MISKRRSVLIIVMMLSAYLAISHFGYPRSGTYKRRSTRSAYGYGNQQQHQIEEMFADDSVLGGKYFYDLFSPEPVRNLSVLPSRESAGVFLDSISSTRAREYVHKPLSNLINAYQLPQINCLKLFQNDSLEVSRAIRYQEQHKKLALPPEFYIAGAKNCSKFLLDRNYVTSVTREEEDFSIAYSILLYKDIEQVERLLRAIYRPHNYYCLHVDVKANAELFEAVSAIASCLHNVFLSSQRYSVRWGHWSVVQPELQCMRELWKYTKWRYFINLTGQEFPLKTNLEIVRLLKNLGGANSIDGTRNRIWANRWKFVYRGRHLVRPLVIKPPTPSGIVLTKGSVHIIAQRGFIDFVLHAHVAIAFERWVQDTAIPDETLFSTLNYSPDLHAPGALTALDKNGKNFPTLTRYKVWIGSRHPCYGKYVRRICIFGLGDLSLLWTKKALFANKFHLDYQPLALDCLEEWHMNKTRLQMEDF